MSRIRVFWVFFGLRLCRIYALLLRIRFCRDNALFCRDYALFCPDFYSDIEDFTQIFCRYLPKKMAAKTSAWPALSYDEGGIKRRQIICVLCLRCSGHITPGSHPLGTLQFNFKSLVIIILTLLKYCFWIIVLLSGPWSWRRTWSPRRWWKAPRWENLTARNGFFIFFMTLFKLGMLG